MFGERIYCYSRIFNDASCMSEGMLLLRGKFL